MAIARSDETLPPGKAFEARVGDVYRALGYQVTPNVELPGKQTDLVARKEMEGAPRVVLAVECKDGQKPIGNETALAFVHRVHTHRDSKAITAGAMISASGFTADARAAVAGSSDVTLLSWEELASQVLDVRHQLRELVSDYEASPIYREYLPLAVQALSWSTLSPVGDSEADLNAVLGRWMVQDANRPNSLFILADFGAGKTTLMSYLQYSRAKAYLANEDVRVPLLVSLREYRETLNVTALLRDAFRDTYYRDVPSDLLWRRIRDGMFFVLLDGFDEMIDRSDAARRLNLFLALSDVFQSASPTVLTSRPSYFIDPGEFESLISVLRAHETALVKPALTAHGGSFAAAERIRRKVVEQHREVRRGPKAYEPLASRGLQVVGLLPLDRERIEELVKSRAPELAEVGATPDDLMGFIERTYDLTDLASRPLLLTIIISAVILGGLDLTDTDAQYGASGLYEIYTNAKLDLDLAKGRVRQEGLSPEVRRMLAEALAIEMYKASTLEMPFSGMLDRLEADGAVQTALEECGLARDEIATDFATCSFVTIDGNGMARFIHKSFRGFFVARVLKDCLRETHHPLLSDPLEREVLYFIGGFAPTQPSVGELLWAKFLRTDKDQTALRRNMLVAYLYSTPYHDTRRIADAEIADAEYGRLAFTGSRMRKVDWRGVTVGALGLDGVNWQDVSLTGCRASTVECRNSRLTVDVHESIIESLETSESSGTLAVETAKIENLSVRGGVLDLTTLDAQLDRVSVEQGHVVAKADAETESSVEAMEVVDGHIELRGVWTGKIRGVRSTVDWEYHRKAQLELDVSSCLVLLSGDLSSSYIRRGRLRLDDKDSIVLARADIEPALLSTVRAGVFGKLASVDGRSTSLPAFEAWGVLDVSSMAERHVLPATGNGWRYGRVLLLRGDRYAQEIQSGGSLEEVHEFPERERFSAPAGQELVDILDRARAAYDALWCDEWPKLGEES
jgi:Restriction endonuclease